MARIFKNDKKKRVVLPMYFFWHFFFQINLLSLETVYRSYNRYHWGQKEKEISCKTRQLMVSIWPQYDRLYSHCITGNTEVSWNQKTSTRQLTSLFIHLASVFTVFWCVLLLLFISPFIIISVTRRTDFSEKCAIVFYSFHFNFKNKSALSQASHPYVNACKTYFLDL